MAFEGDLSHLSLGDVLQTLAMSRQAGTFVVRGTEERRLVLGERGVGLHSVRSAIREKVVAYLLGRGYATPGDVDLATKTQRRRRDASIEDLLVEANAVTDKAVREARRYAAAEEIHDLFLWREGRFEFVGGEVTPADAWGGVWFDIASIAMEAARRMDEIPRLAEIAPLHDVFRRSDSGVPIPDLEGIGLDVHRLLEFVDGTRTVGGVLADFHLGRFDTWKVLAVMREAGLFRPSDREELVETAEALRSAKQHLQAAAILRRLAAEDPSDRDVRISLVDALVAAGERRAGAAEWVAIGRSDLDAADAESAIECFRNASRLDPGGAEAHEGLARALVARGDARGAADAARQAATLRLEAGDPQSAATIAEFGARECPDDVGVRLLLANARVASGDPAEGLRVLFDAATILENGRADDRRLLDIYRRILQLDSERKDCQKRITELETAQRGRRKLLHRAAIGVGVALLGFVAVPILARPGVPGSIVKAHAALGEGDAQRAREISQELMALDLDEEETSLLQDLDAAIQRFEAEEASRSAGPSRAFAAKVAAALAQAAEASRESFAGGLAVHDECAALLESPEAKALANSHASALATARRDAAAELQGHVRVIADEAADAALRVTQARDRFTADVFRREDASQLEALVKLADGVQRVLSGQDWKETARRLDALRTRAGRLPGEDEKRALSAIQVVLDDGPAVLKDGERALALLRKRRLLDQVLSTHGRGQQLLSEGRIEEAAEVYRSFLDACEAMRSHEPRELYAPIIRDYLDVQERHRPAEQRLAEVEKVLAAEARALRALEDGDVAAAFRIRVDLVREHPRVDFRPRFQLPLRVESRPAGAAVWLLDGSPEGRRLGDAPLARVDYPIEGRTRIALRMRGYEESVLERFGAEQDSDGVAVVELPKLAEFTAATGGRIHAAPALADGRIYLAGRDGIVRSVSAETGREISRCDTGLLGGFAGAPVARGGHVWVATLDGLALVLDAATLKELRRAPLAGPARANPVDAGVGVVVADESGAVQCLDESLRPVWKHTFGKIVADPVVVDDTVLVVTLDGELVALDRRSGTVASRVRLPEDPRWGAPAAAGGRAWIGGDGHRVVCVDLRNGRVEWTAEVDGPVRARPARVGDRVVVANSKGGVALLDAASGDEVSRMLVGAPVSGAVLALPEGFAVATERGMVMRFDVEGRTVWRYDAHDDLTAPPALLDGRIHLVTRKGTLIVLVP